MMAELANEELTKAEQKIKDEELTPAELRAFGILPPEPDKPELAQSHEAERKKLVQHLSATKGRNRKSR
jgi:hypothetical protein